MYLRAISHPGTLRQGFLSCPGQCLAPSIPFSHTPHPANHTGGRMGPFPRDAHHPPHTHGELGTKLQAWATSKVPLHVSPLPPSPLLQRQRADAEAHGAAAAQRGAGPATAVTVNYKVLEPRAAARAAAVTVKDML